MLWAYVLAGVSPTQLKSAPPFLLTRLVPGMRRSMGLPLPGALIRAECRSLPHALGGSPGPPEQGPNLGPPAQAASPAVLVPGPTTGTRHRRQEQARFPGPRMAAGALVTLVPSARAGGQVSGGRGHLASVTVQLQTQSSPNTERGFGCLVTKKG